MARDVLGLTAPTQSWALTLAPSRLYPRRLDYTVRGANNLCPGIQNVFCCIWHKMLIITHKKNAAKLNFGDKSPKCPSEPWKAKGYGRFHTLRKLFQQRSKSEPLQGQLSPGEREAKDKLAKNIYIGFSLSLRE